LITFVVLAVLLIGSAVFVVSAPRPVYSVLGLLFNFVCLAIMYLTLNAEFLALIQVLVYGGAILMLFLFVLALLSSGVRPFALGPNRLPRVMWPFGIFALLALAGLLFVIVKSVSPIPTPGTTTSIAGDVGTADVFGSVADFGRALFTTYLLPFEATAFVLMIAVIGVIALAGDVDPPRSIEKRRRRREREREPILKENA
jgi:NADH-quinone oxidoreductase subunit J